MRPAKRKANRCSSCGRPCVKRRLLQHRPTTGFLDLTLGSLHLIFAKVEPDKHQLLRTVCKPLKMEHTDYVLRKYRMCTQKYMKHETEPSLLGYILQVLYLATDSFINFGYQSLFVDKLMPFYRQLCTDDMGELKIEVEDLHQFLHEFYKTVEVTSNVFLAAETGLKQLQHRRLLQTLTLLKLLKQFSEYRVISSGMHVFHWQLHVEVRGIYVGLRDLVTTRVSEEDKFIDFLTIIAELLVYDKSKQCLSRIISIGSNVYIYGVKHQKFPRGPRLNLKFSILAPADSIRVFENVLNNDVISSGAALCPSDYISIQLEVKSKQWHIWMSNEKMSICIQSLH